MLGIPDKFPSYKNSVPATSKTDKTLHKLKQLMLFQGRNNHEMRITK
jgi:hypothetical protein